MGKKGGKDAVESINSDQIDASSAAEGSSEPAAELGNHKKITLNGFVDYPLTKEQHTRANIKLLRCVLA